MDTFDITSLINARKKIEDYRQNLTTDKDKTAAIKAFEYCYELSWKMMKRILALRGKDVYSPRPIFREAALEQLIDNPEVWFEFQEKRNITSHVYNEVEMNAVVSMFETFSIELNKLITNLNQFKI